MKTTQNLDPSLKHVGVTGLLKRVNNFQIIGSFLKKHRRKSRITQESLSLKLNLKNAQFISNIERGLSNLPIKYIDDTAKVLNVPAEELLAVVLASKMPTIKSSKRIMIVCLNNMEFFNMTLNEFINLKKVMCSNEGHRSNPILR